MWVLAWPSGACFGPKSSIVILCSMVAWCGTTSALVAASGWSTQVDHLQGAAVYTEVGWMMIYALVASLTASAMIQRTVTVTLASVWLVVRNEEKRNKDFLGVKTISYVKKDEIIDGACHSMLALLVLGTG